jgi:excinuclease ABC subunit A
MSLGRAKILGGHVVAIGTPEELAANPQSYTGQYLKPVTDRRRVGARPKRAAAAE